MEEENDREPVMFRRIHVTEPTLHLLAEHALTLPHGHPARAAIRLMLHRASKSPRFVPKVDSDPELERIAA